MVYPIKKALNTQPKQPKKRSFVSTGSRVGKAGPPKPFENEIIVLRAPGARQEGTGFGVSYGPDSRLCPFFFPLGMIRYVLFHCVLGINNVLCRGSLLRDCLTF